MKKTAKELTRELVDGESYEYVPLGKHVVAAPGVCGGRPIFKYARLEVSVILIYWPPVGASKKFCAIIPKAAFQPKPLKKPFIRPNKICFDEQNGSAYIFTSATSRVIAQDNSCEVRI